MELYDLDPDSLAAYRARLADEDLSEVELERDPVDGAWVEACTLDLLRFPPDADDRPPVPLHYSFSRYSALPLALSRVVRIAEDLIAEVDAVAEEPPAGRLRAPARRRPGALRRSALPGGRLHGGRQGGRAHGGRGAAGALPAADRVARAVRPGGLPEGRRPMKRGNRVRLTGGLHRGRYLVVPPQARPTEGRVREALFSIWHEPLAAGARVLDLFAGSGVVGLEAASRGALAVVCVEGSRRAFSMLQGNRDRLGEALVEIRRYELPAGLADLRSPGRGPLRPGLRRSALPVLRPTEACWPRSSRSWPRTERWRSSIRRARRWPRRSAA